MEANNYLEHHGIKGQKWGVRRTPEQLGRQNEKLKKDIVKYDQKSANYATKVAKKQQKLYKLTKKRMKGKASSGTMKKELKLSKQLAKMTAKNAKFQRKSAKAKAKIYKNEELIKKMNSQTLSEVNQSTIDKGKKAVEGMI